MQTIFNYFNEPLFSFHRVLPDSYEPKLRLQHFHTYYELSVVMSGKISIFNNGLIVPFERPCIILHAPYSFHTVLTNAGMPYECYVFHFSQECIGGICGGMANLAKLYSPPLTVLPVSDEMSRELLPILSVYSDAPERGNQRRLILACLLELVSRNLSSAITEFATGTPEKLAYVREITDYIDKHYMEQLTAEQLAKQNFISRQKLDADFKKLMNITLKQHIMNIRIANAVRLLSMGKKITDVTYECGFVNESHFIKVFKQRIGVSPYSFSRNSIAELGLVPGSDKNCAAELGLVPGSGNDVNPDEV